MPGLIHFMIMVQPVKTGLNILIGQDDHLLFANLSYQIHGLQDRSQAYITERSPGFDHVEVAVWF